MTRGRCGVRRHLLRASPRRGQRRSLVFDGGFEKDLSGGDLAGKKWMSPARSGF